MSVDVAVALAVEIGLRAGAWRGWTGEGELTLGAKTYAASAEILEVDLPTVEVDDGTGPMSISVGVEDADKADWLAAQGPIPVEVVVLLRNAAGTWEALPHRAVGVLGGSSYADGRWTGTVDSIARSARYQSKGLKWSNVSQLERTDNTDTALSRLRGNGTPLRLPGRLAVPRATRTARPG